jgi:folate-dependent phosphoribosylglycinamide formyltransferase PurN
MTNNVDEGPIIVQKKCKVDINDTPETLKERVQNLEGLSLIETIYYAYNNLLDNNISLSLVKNI